MKTPIPFCRIIANYKLMTSFDDWFISERTGKIFWGLHRLRITSFLMRAALPFYGKANRYDPKDFRIFAVGQSHLDTAWNWRWAPDTAPYKLAHTFGYNLTNLEQFPTDNGRQGYSNGYKFSCPAAAHYDYIERTWPKSFEKIKARVKENRWELTGGMWVESDGNVPDGESFVRQRLYGQRYFIEKFGKKALIEWLPDSFGFAWTLPQILVKSGAKGFYTTKMTWNVESKPGTGRPFPFGWYYWQSPDGSKILSFNFKGGWRGLEYIGHAKERCRLAKDSADRTFSYNNDMEHEPRLDSKFIPEVIWTYGEGDGGHGPRQVEIMVTDACERAGAMQQVKAGVVYKLIEKKYGGEQSLIPIWNDELYLEVHRGVQTTLHRLKQQNRIAETSLQSLEKLQSFLLSYGYEYPKEQMDKIWKTVLFNHFHDILPGSSIQEVYEDTDRDFNEIISPGIQKIYQDLGTELISKIIPKNNEGDLLIFYPHQWEGPVKIEFPSKKITDVSPKNEVYYHSKPKGIGFEILKIANLNENFGSISVNEKELELEVQTPYYQATFIKKSGSISSLILGKNKTQFVSNSLPELNQLRLFTDPLKGNDAWNLDPFYRDKKLLNPVFSNCKINKYPNRMEIVFNIAVGDKSKGTMTYIVTSAVPYIECLLDLDFQEQHKLLRVEFETNLEDEQFTTGIPYGWINRPTHPTLPLQIARWEVPGAKFINLDDPSKKCGLAVLVFDRYGFDCEGSRFGISLLRGPIFEPPDKNACKWYDPKTLPQRLTHKDLGRHLIRWAILPHEGSWQDAGVFQQAMQFNFAPVVFPLASFKPQKTLPSVYFPGLPIQIDAPNVQFSVMKPGYDCNNNHPIMIIRVNEFLGKATPVKIAWNLLKTAKIRECDLLEFNLPIPSNQTVIKRENDGIRFTIQPFEIKSFRIEL